jgi:DNA polymerase delta subunit 2
VPVDVMPGPEDPSNYTLPQQPLHHCLLPRAARYSTVRLVTNPFEAWVGRRLLLGCSGQTIEDMLKYTRVETGPEGEGNGVTEADAMEVDAASRPAVDPVHRLLEDTLRWRHMAPTAPDTLPCYPFCDSDPFVLEECPHVYFCGNQVRALALIRVGLGLGGSDFLLVWLLLVGLGSGVSAPRWWWGFMASACA